MAFARGRKICAMESLSSGSGQKRRAFAFVAARAGPQRAHVAWRPRTRQELAGPAQQPKRYHGRPGRPPTPAANSVRCRTGPAVGCSQASRGDVRRTSSGCCNARSGNLGRFGWLCSGGAARGRRARRPSMRVAAPIIASCLLAVSGGAAFAQYVDPLRVLESSRRDRLEMDKRLAREAAARRQKEKADQAAQANAQRKLDMAAAASGAPTPDTPPARLEASPAREI